MFNLIFTCLACAGLAFGANNIDKVQYQSNGNVVFHQELKRNATYNDESHTITLTADELNNYTWINLNDTFVEIGSPYNYFDSYTDPLYDGNSIVFDNYTINDNVITFYADIDTSILIFGQFTLDDHLYGNDDKFTMYTYNELTEYYSELSTFNGNLVIKFNSTYYDDFKTAIQADILANQPVNDNYAGALGDFVTIMVAGLQDFGAGVANGVADFASALFLATDSGGNVTGLSIFGGIIAIFAGLALAVGITTRVYLWVTSLGK